MLFRLQTLTCSKKITLFEKTFHMEANKSINFSGYFYLYRHERKTHDNIPDQSSSVSGEPQEQVVEDYKYNYHVARLFYGLLMVNTHDSIREGDAARLMDCMKMSLTNTLTQCCCFFVKYLQFCLKGKLSIFAGIAFLTEKGERAKTSHLI